MLKNFQREDAHGRKVAQDCQLWTRCQLEWLRYLEQSKITNFALTFAVVISVGVVIGFILQT